MILTFFRNDLICWYVEEIPVSFLEDITVKKLLVLFKKTLTLPLKSDFESWSRLYDDILGVFVPQVEHVCVVDFDHGISGDEAGPFSGGANIDLQRNETVVKRRRVSLVRKRQSVRLLLLQEYDTNKINWSC